MHYLWGSYPILFRSLSLCFYHNILLIHLSLCFWKTSLFLVGTLCHHEKCGEFDLRVGTLLSYWELVISFLDIYFYLLEWDKFLSMCVLFDSYAHSFLLSAFGTLCLIMCWLGSLIYFGQSFRVTLLVCFLGLLGVLFKLYLLLVLESFMHAYYYMYILWHACFLWSYI